MNLVSQMQNQVQINSCAGASPSKRVGADARVVPGASAIPGADFTDRWASCASSCPSAGASPYEFQVQLRK